MIEVLGRALGCAPRLTASGPGSTFAAASDRERGRGFDGALGVRRKASRIERASNGTRRVRLAHARGCSERQGVTCERSNDHEPWFQAVAHGERQRRRARPVLLALDRPRQARGQLERVGRLPLHGWGELYRQHRTGLGPAQRQPAARSWVDQHGLRCRERPYSRPGTEGMHRRARASAHRHVDRCAHAQGRPAGDRPTQVGKRHAHPSPRHQRMHHGAAASRTWHRDRGRSRTVVGEGHTCSRSNRQDPAWRGKG